MKQRFLDEFLEEGFEDEALETEFETQDGFVNHPNLKPESIKPREFQLNIAENSLKNNTLVVLPTGLGKTYIALLVTAKFLPKRVLFLAPSKPLVLQHFHSCERCLKTKINFLTGEIRPKERESIWKTFPVLVSTPQTVRNDLENERYRINERKLLIFDEAHKAVGDYSYVKIAEKFRNRILGLTASPGGKKKKIKEVLENLKIENIEARSKVDKDVRDYIKKTEVSYKPVNLNKEMLELKGLLEEYLVEKIEKLNKLGFLTYKKPEHISKTDIIRCRKRISKRFKQSRKKYLFGAFHNQGLALQAYHTLELLESQGVNPMVEYFEQENGKAKKSFKKDKRVREVLQKANNTEEISHPKLKKLKEILQKQFKKEDSLVLVFTQYRKTIDSIQKICDEINEVRGERLVGQSGEKGLTQDEQKEILERFESGDINLLISTSIGEEGISIPNVDLVVFYEPIPSEIRAIQRRGRTGRTSIGKVEILITKDSRDEAYLHAEKAREEKMKKIVGWLKRKQS